MQIFLATISKVINTFFHAGLFSSNRKSSTVLLANSNLYPTINANTILLLVGLRSLKNSDNILSEFNFFYVTNIYYFCKKIFKLIESNSG